MGNAPQNEFIQVHSILFPGLGFFLALNRSQDVPKESTDVSKDVRTIY